MNLRASLDSEENKDNGIHEDEVPHPNDTNLPKSKIRRSRLKTLFEEFQKEVSGLEENIEELAAENARLKSTNENLRQRLDDDETTKGKDAESSGEISAIIKLSNKLQEMIQANEDITRVNAVLRRDLKGLQNEREGHLKDIAKLREENKMSRMALSFNKYSESDISKDQSYDRKRRTPIKPSDSYNSEDLNREFDKFTNDYTKNSSSLLSDEATTIKDYSFDSMAVRNRSPSCYQSDRVKKVISPVLNNSATEALQKLVSKVDQTHNDSSNMLNNGSHSPTNERATPQNNSSHIKSLSSKLDHSVETSDVLSPGNKEAGVRYSDPLRYPACVKLLELTKARIGDEIMNQSSRLSPTQSETDKTYETAPSEYWSNGLTNIGSNGGPIVHHHASADNMSEHDRTSHKGVVEDDITIVLPSSDHSLSRSLSTGSADNIQPRDIRYSPPNLSSGVNNFHSGRDMMYTNSQNTDSRLRSPMMEQMHNSTSAMENQRVTPPEMKSLEVVVSSSSEYMYNYSSTTFNHRYPPPMKRIKVEDVFK